jgi:hypothetical protein
VIRVAGAGTVAGVADPGRDARSSPQICRGQRHAATAEVETRRPRRVRVDGDPTPSTPAVATARFGNLPGIIEELE